jgi:hypothetical protein
MSSQQRSDVWRGIRQKTSGGLTKDMLTKNKRGKIVSKKKSGQASDQNNLGSWLRQKGKKIAKKDMLQKKSAPPEDAPKSKKKAPKKAAPKKAAPKKAAPKPKAAPKATPKPTVAAPKKKPKVVRKQIKAKPKSKKVGKTANINPITQQPYEKKSKSGYVEGGALSLDNLKRTKRVRKKRVIHNIGGF